MRSLEMVFCKPARTISTLPGKAKGLSLATDDGHPPDSTLHVCVARSFMIAFYMFYSAIDHQKNSAGEDADD